MRWIWRGEAVFGAALCGAWLSGCFLNGGALEAGSGRTTEGAGAAAGQGAGATSSSGDTTSGQAGSGAASGSGGNGGSLAGGTAGSSGSDSGGSGGSGDPTCGDMKAQDGEACDDGNEIEGDGCNACQRDCGCPGCDGMTGCFNCPKLGQTTWKDIDSQICYTFVPKPDEWDDARSYCKELGGDLVAPSTQEELNLIMDIEHLPIFVGNLTGRCWTGGTDEDEEDTFVWSNDELWLDGSVGGPPWGPGEPKNDDDSDCVALGLTVQEANLRVRHCDEKSPYVCEYPPAPPP